MAVKQSLSVTEVPGWVVATTNTSLVKIVWTSTQSGESWNGYTRTARYYVSINGGAETEYTVDYTLPQSTTVTLVNSEFFVQHKSDGTGTVKVRTWMDTGISAGVVEMSKTLELTPIARASEILNISDTTLGENYKIQFQVFDASYRFKIVLSMGDRNFTSPLYIVDSVALTTFSIPLSLDWASQIPNAKSGTMTATLYTYNKTGISQIGSPSSKTFTVTVPDNELTQPTVSMSLSPSSNLPSPYNSLYIQGHSKVKASLGFDTKYGSTVAASNITVNGNTYASPYESDILSQVGKASVKATVKDSRGYYGTNYKEIEVIPYAKPYIRAKSGESSIIVARCDSSANFTDSGTYLKIKAKVVYSKVISNGVQNNYGNIKFRYRKEGGAYSAWQTILNCKTDNSDEVITPPLLNGALDIKSNYQVQIVAYDGLCESLPVTFAVPSDAVYMDRPAGGKSMGLGGYSSGDENLDIYWKTKARGGLSLFDAKGDEIPLDSTMPLPRGQVAEGWNPDNLENGIYVVTSAKALKSGDTVIMYNGVLIQMNGTVDGSVKIQLALTSDENKNPYYRAYWYGNWGNWRSMKL